MGRRGRERRRIGDQIPLPTRATDGSAGMDLRACIDNMLEIKPGETHLISNLLKPHFAENTTYFEMHFSHLGNKFIE